MKIDDHTVVHVRDVLQYLESDRYLGKAEAAKYLGVSVRTVEGWMDRLPRYKPNGKVLFKKSELDQFMRLHLEQPNEVDVERLADDAVAAVMRR